MAQKQDDKIIAYVEPLLGVILRKLCDESLHESYSTYMRKLVIKDLKERGLLTDQMIIQNLC